MKKLLTACKSEVVYKIMVAITCMLCTAPAMAVSYSIANRDDDTGVCHSVKIALQKGLVIDALRPLCERRFELSPAAKALGLSGIEMELLPSSAYPDLLQKILAVTGQEEMPQSKVDLNKNKELIDKYINSGDIKIYDSNFDADNSGKSKMVYITDISSCQNKNNYWDASVTTTIQNEDGTLDRSWGVRDATAGIPFTYENSTYYVKWAFLAGSVKKGALAQLDIYHSVAYSKELQKITPYAVFPPAYCTIYQMDH